MEKMYQYLWQHRMLGRSDFVLVDGRPLTVLHPGILNNDAGPDFFNARLRIGEENWAGNVEIHVRASDWERHHHDSDPAYSNVILHVVAADDSRIGRPDGSEVPQLLITLPEGFHTLWSVLSSPGSDIRCRSWLSRLHPLVVTDWLESLFIERLQSKASRIAGYLGETENDWEQACFTALARGLGFGLNSEPFEMLARSLPLKILHRHSDSLFQLQALCFGQAGLLDSSVRIFDEYYQNLCREYYFLRRKYSLQPIRTTWKFARTRPQNSPHRRIAMLAMTAFGGFSLARRLIEESDDPEALLSLFDWRLEGFWADHFSFDSEASPGAPAVMSRTSRQLLVINVAVPFIYAYGASRGNYMIEQRASEIMERLDAESNGVVRTWASLGLAADSAMRSQALLHLKKEYCDASKCLYCRFGHRLVAASLKS